MRRAVPFIRASSIAIAFGEKDTSVNVDSRLRKRIVVVPVIVRWSKSGFTSTS